ncbi:uncharacterized protein TNIN_136801 [Trichonephila inaurata madagascariensis]|uniref:Uncharacterized protein n=1 Tax=Trichonephila inaurata madagascariensis TaxID=2747483 RepID=A0A8X6KBZ2_9ARAC|nr:uncharacterized protein TNIN_136801 [Trichonephila inaurata madagascariensis]
MVSFDLGEWGGPTYLCPHQCRVDTLIVLGVEGFEGVCGEIGLCFVLRTSFTKTANVLKAELVNVEFSVDLVRDKFTKLQSVYLDIKVLDEKIIDLLAEDVKSSESDIAKEIEDREVYSDDLNIVTEVGEDCEFLMKVGKKVKSGFSVSLDRIKQYRLPKIELKSLRRGVGNFGSFFAIWKIHRGPDLFESDKFSILNVWEPGRVRKILKKYPVREL